MVSRQAIWARSKQERQWLERRFWRALALLAEKPVVEDAERPMEVTTELRDTGYARVARRFRDFGGWPRQRWWTLQEIEITDEGRAALAKRCATGQGGME